MLPDTVPPRAKPRRKNTIVDRTSFNIFISAHRSTGDVMDFKQRLNNDLAHLILQTLEIFEEYGGDDAFINIKHVPFLLSQSTSFSRVI